MALAGENYGRESTIRANASLIRSPGRDGFSQKGRSGWRVTRRERS